MSFFKDAQHAMSPAGRYCALRPAPPEVHEHQPRKQRKPQGLRLTESVCDSKGSRCYALAHVLIHSKDLKEVVLNTSDKKGRLKIGVGLSVKIKGRKLRYFFMFCPWCGKALQ